MDIFGFKRQNAKISARKINQPDCMKAPLVGRQQVVELIKRTFKIYYQHDFFLLHGQIRDINHPS